MNQPVVEVNELGYVYPDGRRALEDVAFQVYEGETVGIIGANGAGKSTLLMQLMGILLPSRGEVLVQGEKVTKKSLQKIRAKMGLVFQNPDDQLFMTTVYDDVAFGPRNYKLNEQEVENRVCEALKTVGILHLKDRAPFRLSGGEKRAAAIAAVLSMQPEILVMDEPTAALDPKSRRRIMTLLKGFSHTKMIATHDMDMVFDLCERTIVLKEGRIISDGRTREILQDGKLLEGCGLEIPLALQNCPLCNLKKCWS
ncbi:MAG: ATP-binding cassette domain-containing protein [Clostridia bacterium]|nr:ATP-binding cassette domain-containing protein [Clostridia bacterium]